MAQIISNPEIPQLKGQMAHWAYNGLDCCVTREVFDVIGPRLNEITGQTYRFEMATQAPAMAMMRRGVLVDDAARKRALAELETQEKASHAEINAMLPAGTWVRTAKVAGKCPARKTTAGDKQANHKWGPKEAPEPEQVCEACGQHRYVPASFNPNSDDQAKELFYERLGVKPQTNKKGLVSVDETALEKIAEKYPDHAPLVKAIIKARGIRKQIGVLNSGVSADGRMRSSFNVGAPETGRWSSSKNHYGEGTNLQNITEGQRYIFIADPGMELVYADLEQAESKCVAYLAEDERYIEAHNLGDVHTYVTRLVWPELPWTGDLEKDKTIAEQPAPFDHLGGSYRLNCKRIQHGSNYGLTPYGLARIAHIPLRDAERAQENYFTEFPGIPAWQRSVIRELTETHTITTPLGRRRQFFGRHWDKHVQRQAIAFIPQSMVADILNLALWRMWREMDMQIDACRPPRVSDPNRLWLLAQVHDAVLAEVRVGDTQALRDMLELMKVPVTINGRVMVIGTEAAVGRNWGKYHPEKNPGGVRKWKPN